MKKYLVIGNPIEHSLSPKLHNYWIKENKIEAVYNKKKLGENDLEIVISDTSFTDELDKSDQVAAEWRRRHIRSPQPAHRSERDR